MIDMKQAELDAFEEAVLIGLFDKPALPKWVDLAFSLQGINPQDYIDKFEEVVRPFMKDNGLVNAENLKKLVALKYPKYAELIPNQDFRLVDSVGNVVNFLGSFKNFVVKG